MEQQPNNSFQNDTQTIDLRKSLSSVSDGVNRGIYACLKFMRRNIFWIAGLVILGVAIGMWLDGSRKYEQEIIVIPNVSATEQLYSKIAELDAKVRDKDSAFLKSIGIPDSKLIVSVKIEAVTQLFPFANSNEHNIDVLKLLSESGDIKKLSEDDVMSRNYRFHRISIVTKKPATQKNLVKPLMDYLNASEYFDRVRAQYVKNMEQRIAANERTVQQIDGVLNMFSSYEGGKGSSMVYYNNQLNDVIKSKENIIEETGNLRIEIIANEKIIRESSENLNMVDAKKTAGRMKFIIPILFLMIFLFFNRLRHIYRSQSAREKNLTA